jgi:CheY-like chemotaxis protein
MARIFVVDDDPLMRELLLRRLRGIGEVETFSSAEAALLALDRGLPDLLVTDLKLPGMDGASLAAEMRRKGVPAVLLSGSKEDLEAAAARCQAFARFTKPVRSMERLEETVRALLDRTEAVERRASLAIGDDFAMELAHELRTPLTALRLALEGLWEGSADPDTGRRLLGIARKNVDRLVQLVERELGILQVALGGPFVARRLVDLSALAASVLGEGKERGPAWSFTDPEWIRTILSQWTSRIEPAESIRWGIEREPEGWRLVVNLAGGNGSSREASGLPRVDSPAAANGPGGIGRFARAALDEIVRALDGRWWGEGNGVGSSFHLLLPIWPPYDRRRDLVHPMRQVRRAGGLAGQPVTFLALTVDAPDDPLLVLPRCRQALAEGEAILRSRRPGDFYLLLVDRRREEAEALRETLVESLRSSGWRGELRLLHHILPEEPLPVAGAL